MVSLGGIGGDHHENTPNDEEVVNDGPPGIGWETVPGLDLSYNRRDERYHPCQLARRQLRALQMTKGLGAETRDAEERARESQGPRALRPAVWDGQAYCRNRNGCEGKRVADYVAHVDAAATVLPRVLHFAQGRGME